MKHIIIGGDGYVGRYLARDLIARGEDVVICDIHQSSLPIYPKAAFHHVDITDARTLDHVPMGADDIVYNMAARLLHPIVPRRQRHDYFFSVDYVGVKNVVQSMNKRGCHKLVQFSTDMVYGRPRTNGAIEEDHPREPLGAYGESKKRCEDLCAELRGQGWKTSVFRPRMIIGPGRLGILGHLFWLIEHSLPVPLIGNGSNHYQMVSVFDCAAVALRSTELGVVNGEFNLGSRNPPTVRALLRDLITEVGSRSALLSTPAGLVKKVLTLLDFVGLPLLVPEQYEIADTDFVVSMEKTERVLDWRPKYDDTNMLIAAYREYLAKSGPALVAT